MVLAAAVKKVCTFHNLLSGALALAGELEGAHLWTVVGVVGVPRDQAHRLEVLLAAAVAALGGAHIYVHPLVQLTGRLLHHHQPVALGVARVAWLHGGRRRGAALSSPGELVGSRLALGHVVLFLFSGLDQSLDLLLALLHNGFYLLTEIENSTLVFWRISLQDTLLQLNLIVITLPKVM
jgi:hypothetical protein